MLSVTILGLSIHFQYAVISSAAVFGFLKLAYHLLPQRTPALYGNQSGSPGCECSHSSVISDLGACGDAVSHLFMELVHRGRNWRY